MKSYIRIFICICLIGCIYMPKNALAEENIGISIEYGIDGKIQMGKGFPMTIKLSNKGKDISGDLVIFSNPTYDMQGNIVVPIELSSGEEKIFKVSVPGYGDYFSYQPNNQPSLIRFYEDGWEKGKEIKLDGNKKFTASYFQENRLIIGALSDSPDSLNFLKLTKFNGEPVEFLSLNENSLPDDSQGMEIFDVMLINDYNISTLSAQQQQALRDWVIAGGHLMFGSTAGLPQQLGNLDDFSLLTINDQQSFDDLNFFLKTSTETMPDFKTVEIMTGDVKDKTKVLYTDHSLPIVMNKTFGLGGVTQFSFNIGNDTLKKWEPYASWWEDVFRNTVNKDVYGHQPLMLEELTYQLGNIVDAFPTSFIPLTLLIILFIAYLLFLVPGLYFILKKLDKRESSWWIIPTIAFISSISIFIIGAKDRIGGSQLNDVSILAIDDTGNASGYGAISILTNSGGDYRLRIKPNEFKPFPMNRYNHSDDVRMNYAMVESGQQQTNITFNEVEYWSIRSAIGKIQSKEIGKLTTDLKVESGKLVGTVNSSLTLDIEEAFLLIGNKAYSLGSIKAGSTETVSIKVDDKKLENTVSAPALTVASSAIPGFYNAYYGGGPDDKESLEQWKKYELLNTAITQKMYQKDLNQPLIAGFINDSIINVETDKKKTKTTSLTLVTQAVEVMPAISGEFTLTETIPSIAILEGTEGFIHYNGLAMGDNFVEVENGTYQLTYQLPSQIEKDKANFNTLKLNMTQVNRTVFYIFNNETNEFMPLDENKTEILFEENVNTFLSEDGAIVLMFEKSGQGNPTVHIPGVYLEGAYKND